AVGGPETKRVERSPDQLRRAAESEHFDEARVGVDEPAVARVEDADRRGAGLEDLAIARLRVMRDPFLLAPLRDVLEQQPHAVGRNRERGDREMARRIVGPGALAEVRRSSRAQHFDDLRPKGRTRDLGKVVVDALSDRRGGHVGDRRGGGIERENAQRRGIVWLFQPYYGHAEGGPLEELLGELSQICKAMRTHEAALHRGLHDTTRCYIETLS